MVVLCLDSPILDGVYLDDLLVVQRCSHHQTVPTDGSFIPEPPQPGDADVRRVAAAEEAYGGRRASEGNS